MTQAVRGAERRSPPGDGALTAGDAWLAIGLSTVLGVLLWLGGDGAGWLDDGLPYTAGTIAALIALVALIAVLALAVVSALEGEPWALFIGRRPDLIAAAATVAMLAIGFLVSGYIAMEQGETEWEPSDKGLFIGGVTHFVAIGCLVVALWWKRAVTPLIVAAPVVTGVLALRALPGWVSEDADFRDDATVADGFLDVLRFTLVSALLMAAVLALVLVRRRAARADPVDGSPR